MIIFLAHDSDKIVNVGIKYFTVYSHIQCSKVHDLNVSKFVSIILVLRKIIFPFFLVICGVAIIWTFFRRHILTKIFQIKIGDTICYPYS